MANPKTKKTLRKFLIASGYMGECCADIHTLVKVISATDEARAKEKMCSYLETRGFTSDSDPVVVPASFLRTMARKP
jgi:hypothetical protein